MSCRRKGRRSMRGGRGSRRRMDRRDRRRRRGVNLQLVRQGLTSGLLTSWRQLVTTSRSLAASSTPGSRSSTTTASFSPPPAPFDQLIRSGQIRSGQIRSGPVAVLTKNILMLLDLATWVPFYKVVLPLALSHCIGNLPFSGADPQARRAIFF